MKPIRATRTIAAPLELVFQTLSDPRNYSKAVPQIAKVEFLSEQRTGAGTRFRETRAMHGREHTSDLEITEFVENERLRTVTDVGGTIWDTVFTVSENYAGAVVLEMAMDVRPHTLFARIITPLIRGTVVRGVESDMDAVKAFCEAEQD